MSKRGKSNKSLAKPNRRIVWKKGEEWNFQTEADLWEEYGDLVPQVVLNAVKATKSVKTWKGEWQ